MKKIIQKLIVIHLTQLSTNCVSPHLWLWL